MNRWSIVFSCVAVVANGFIQKSPYSVWPLSNASTRRSDNLLVCNAVIPRGEQAKTSSASTSNPPDMKAYASAYKTVFEEIPCRLCTPSEGSVPEDLVGSYYRAGPAMFSAGSIIPPRTSIVQPRQPPVPDGQDADRMVAHPSEGDGAMLGVTFSDSGEVTARYRYIRTPGFTNERKKGAKVYTGMDSTRSLGPKVAGGLGNDLPLPLFRHHLQPGLNKNRKNTSNTRAMYWGKRLISMWEGGQPYKMDALALSTEGRSMLGGAIRREADPFGCKMVVDSESDRALAYGVELGNSKTEVALYEFDSKFRMVKDGRTYVNLPGCALITDFAASKTWAIFHQPNLAVSGMQFLVGKEPGKTLSAQEGSSTLHFIPRAGSSGEQCSIPLPNDGFFDGNIQFINAYEDGDEVTVDVIRSNGSNVRGNSALSWPWGTDLSEYQSCTSKKSLWRIVTNTRTQSVSTRELISTHAFFGTVNPEVSAQRHRYVYLNVGSLADEVAPLQGIAKFDCESGETQVWLPKNSEFCGEPIYARRKNATAEDGGYILSVLYSGDNETSELLILDATKIGEGPIARLPLGVAIPHGLFGCFTDAEEASWDFETIERRSKLADKMESRGNMWNEVKSDFSGLGLRFDDMEEYFGDFFN